MDLADVFLNFQTNTANRFKEGSQSAGRYWRFFTRFCEQSGATKMTKEDLAKQGRKLLLPFMQSIPLRSRRVALVALETVWKQGLEIGWPLDTKRDFARTLPQVGHRETPPDADIRPWADAVQHEDKPMVKAMMMCLVQYGWRPGNQLAQLKWRNVRWQNGHVTAFVADGQREDFKTAAWIVAHTFPSVASSVEAWHSVSPKTQPSDFVFIRR